MVYPETAYPANDSRTQSTDFPRIEPTCSKAVLLVASERGGPKPLLDMVLPERIELSTSPLPRGYLPLAA
jgi:hypothetical protein